MLMYPTVCGPTNDNLRWKEKDTESQKETATLMCAYVNVFTCLSSFLRQSPVTICYVSINILENLHKMLRALAFQEQDEPQKKRETNGEHKIKINS